MSTMRLEPYSNTATYLLGDKYKRKTTATSSYDVKDLIRPLHSIFLEIDDIVNSDDFSGDPNAYAKELVQKVEEIVRNLPPPDVEEKVVSPRKWKHCQEACLSSCLAVERMRDFIRWVGEGRYISPHRKKEMSERSIEGELETPPKSANRFFHDPWN
jgi:hypothetical protein